MISENIKETKGFKYNNGVVPYERIFIMYQEDWDNFSSHPRFFEACYCREKDPNNVYVFLEKSQEWDLGGQLGGIYRVEKIEEVIKEGKPFKNDGLKLNTSDFKIIFDGLLSDVYRDFFNYERELDILGEESLLDETDNPFYCPVDNWYWRYKFTNKNINPKYV
jgi:hypothetical protein